MYGIPDTVWMEIGSSVEEEVAESVYFLRHVFEREEEVAESVYFLRHVFEREEDWP